MRNASTEFNKYVSSGGLFYMSADVTFANGTRMHLDKKDFYISVNNFTDGAGANSLPVGVAMAKTVQICLVNDDDRFSEYDFYHAKFTIYAYAENIGEDKLVESVKIGTFTVITPENYGNKITVTAVDDMYKADVDYTTELTFPQTVKAVIKDSTDRLGIDLAESYIPYPEYVIQKRLENITHRQLYGLVAMMIGGNARISSDNYLEFISYDKNFLSEKMLDGGNFEYYISGDAVDGGNFTNYNSEDSVDGGNFDSLKKYHSFSSATSPKISTDDVIITGVRILVDGENYLYGSEGYVIELSNDLIVNDTENVINGIGTALVGLRFRPFELENISNPLAEFGDSCYVSDTKGNMYKSIITDIEFEWFGKTKVKCSAEPPLRNSSKYLSETAQQIAQVKKETGNILGKVDKIEKEQGSLSSKVSAVEGQITAESTRAQGAERVLSGRIDVLPENVTLSVSDTKGSASISIKVDYADGTSSTQTKTIDLNADTINLNANDILNLISNNEINLSSMDISIKSAYFEVSPNGSVKCQSLQAISDEGIIFTGKIFCNNDIDTFGGITVQPGSEINFHSPLYMHYPWIYLNSHFSMHNADDFVELCYSSDSGLKTPLEITKEGILTTKGGINASYLCTNGKTTSSDGKAGVVIQNEGGIDICGYNPYIDFHFNNSTSDYTSRIVEKSSGALTVYNSISNASDKRLKKDIVSLDNNFVNLIDNIEPKQYRFKKGDEYLKLGFIAQEMEKAMDDLGVEDKPIVAVPESEDGYYALDYNDLIAVLWKDARNQHDENKALKEEIKVLKETVNKLVEKVGV